MRLSKIYLVVALGLLINLSIVSCDNNEQKSNISTKSISIDFNSILPDSLKCPEDQFLTNFKRFSTSVIENRRNDYPYSFLHASIIYEDTNNVEFNRFVDSISQTVLKVFDNDGTNFDIFSVSTDMFYIYKVKRNPHINGSAMNLLQNILDTLGNKPFLPFFYDYFSDEDDNENNISDTTTKLGIKKEYKVYLTNCGNWNVLPKEYSSTNELLPEKFKHGFIKGFIRKENENRVYFWVVAW